MLFTVDFALRIVASLVGAVIGGLLPTLLRGVMPLPDALRWTIVFASVMFAASALPALGLRETQLRDGKGWPSYLRSIREFSSWRRLASLAVPEAIISLGAGLVMPFVPLLLNAHLGANVAQIGFIQGATSLAMAVATLMTPLLARKLGLMGTVVITQLASLPFLLVIPLAQSLPIVAVAMWVRTALMNMAWPVYNQVAVEDVPAQDKPLVSGWVAVAWSVAWLTGSAWGGRLAASSYTIGYFITAALYAVGAVVAWLLLRHVRTAIEPVASELVAQGLTLDAAEPRA
jgi:predicted MFS family arabinose efflux permease